MLNVNPMKLKLFVWGLLVCLLFCGAQWAMAQETTGTISGTVSDSTGAMVPKATVTITNEKTGQKRVVQTNDTGFFTAPELPVGSYSVSASATGFKVAENTGIDLHVTEQKMVPIILQVGVQTETVTVTGGATQVNLRTGEVGSLVGAQQMTELPLNGRSFVQLTLLAPGASVGDSVSTRNTGLLSGVDISMSGSGANTNAWLVDGADNVDHGSGRTILVFPSVDSIEEFKVRRNSFGADSPASGGAQINLVTKSGTNRFHGSAYEFFRNDKLDAANFFLNSANQKKGELRSNDFGYTVGGPIKKDKAFFFWSEEWRREIRGVTHRATVPTAAERAGNFNGTLTGGAKVPIDPYTGLPYPGNQIPACAPGQTTDCLSPAGSALLQLYPLPDTAATLNNWVQAVPTAIPTRQEQIRTDVNFSQNSSLMFRYTQDAWANPAPNIGGAGGLWGDDGFPTVDSSWSQPGKNLSTRFTHTFGPSMINEAQFTYSGNKINITEGLGKALNNQIVNAIPTVFPAAADRTHAIFWGAAPNASSSLWNIAPWKNWMDLYVFQDDLTKVHGNHTMKFGGLFSTNYKREIGCCGNNPLQFWGPNAVPGGAGKGGGWGDSKAPGNGGNVTGNATADMLLRGAYFGGSEQSFLPLFKPDWKNYEFYGTDTYRMTSRLTLDFGLRWTLLPSEIQDDGLTANFVPSIYNPATAGTNPLDGLIFPTNYVNTAAGITGGPANLHGVNVNPRSLLQNHNNLFAPRFGFAWDPTGSGKWAIRGGTGIFFGRADLSHPLAELVNNPPFTSVVNWGSGRPLDQIPSNVPTSGVGTAANAADITAKVEGSYQWNFTVERELAKDTKLEVSYIGNHGHNLPYNYNLNDVAPANWLQYARINYAPQNDPNVAGLNKDALRPYFALKGSNGLIYQTYGGNSSYNSLQVFFTKRYSNNFSVQAAYTWSKSLSDTSLTCCGGGNGSRLTVASNPRYDRGLSDFDRSNILTLNSIYHAPSFAGKSWLERGVLDGWEMTGIYSFSSGIPLTPHLNTTLVGVDNNSQIRPDLVVSGAPGSRNANQWVTANDYAFPIQLGRLGNAPHGGVRAPPLNDLDFAMYKNFPLRWESSYLQLRFETFNTLNHPQLQNIDMAYTPAGLTANTTTNMFTGCNTINGNAFPFCNTDGNFGKPGSARDPRELQFALKFVF
ncbi:MAG TPA: carboxypeptidase-like regulatory domain-containing protein [Terriglobia bacterium]|nr:carboxypeptidase-like regulatory domain-containing protein [Terriglobia bacterium]